MTPDMWLVFGLLAAVIVLFMSDRVRLDIVALLAILVLLLSGQLTPAEALSGFSNTIVILIAGLFVVGEALSRTGIASAIGVWLGRSSRGGLVGLQVRLMLVVAVLSAFMSSTGAVAVFIPVAVGLARRSGIPTKKLLMPMAFAALFGGMLTLIGTPPNIIVSEELANHGYERFAFADFTPVGLVLLAAGILFMTTLGARLLPGGGESTAGATGRTLDDMTTAYGLKGSFLMLRVQRRSELAGQTVSASRLRSRLGLTVIGIQRSGRVGHKLAYTAEPDRVLLAGDELLVQVGSGVPPEEVELTAIGLQVLEGLATSGALDSEVGLVEVVVPPRSGLIGKSPRELSFRDRFGLHVLSLQRGGETIVQKPADQSLAAGDALLLGGAWQKIDTLRREQADLVMLQMPDEWRDVAPTHRRAPVALLILAAMLVAMIFELLPAVTAVLAAAVAMVLTGCLSMDRAYKCINWQSLVLIAGMLPMGTALQKSGGLAFIVEHLVAALGGVGPYGILVTLFLITAVFSQVISNTATTVLLAPIGIGIAEQMGVNPQPLVMAIALAASAAFITPMASPVNTLVLGPGGYKFSDFVKVGLPLVGITLILTTLLVPLLFPFE